jgi:hypothetical protein
MKKRSLNWTHDGLPIVDGFDVIADAVKDVPFVNWEAISRLAELDDLTHDPLRDPSSSESLHSPASYEPEDQDYDYLIGYNKDPF